MSAQEQWGNPIFTLLKLPFVLLGYVALTLVIALVIEIIYSQFIKPDVGVSHSREMYKHELVALDNPITGQRNTITNSALWLTLKIEQFPFIKSLRDKNNGPSKAFEIDVGQARKIKHPVAILTESLETFINVIQTIILRIGVVFNAYIYLIVLLGWAFIEGLCRHLLRSAGAIPTSNIIYTHNKWITRALLFLPAIIYLGSPISLPAWLVFNVLMLPIVIGVIIWVSYYIKL